ncbi:MAG: NTP transferase domain-containing protein [Nanoarchaeota archaeon]|nr:NTP transferase domain-containing protein [Nanoarchaeota archaeon]
MSAIERAIILVAGMGSRLEPITNTVPKCLVRVKEKPILVNSLDNLAKIGIKEVIIVIGHLGEKIRNEIGDQYKGMKVIYIENKFYDKTNNMYSLWLAREYLEKGVVLLEGDTFFGEVLLRKVIETDNRSYWAGDKFSLFRDGCMLTSGNDGSIKKIEIIRGKAGQEREFEDHHHKSGDIIKIMPELGVLLSEWLDKEVKEGNVNIYYDLVLAKYLQEGQIFVCDINGLKWMEIDDHEDLRRAENMFGELVGSVFERKYEIVPIERLKPLEKVFPNHLKNLNKLILDDGVIKAPLLADRETGIVLDGSHRYIFFLMHGYKKVPVHFVSYQDENIRVGTHLLHRHLIVGKTNISKAEVIERGLSGNIFAPRITRHFFPFRKIDDADIPLTELKKGEPIDVSKYIENATVQDEIIHNEKFIEEINQEVDETLNYLYEAREVKEYLKFQVKEMKKKEQIKS